MESDGMGESRRAWEPRREAYCRREAMRAQESIGDVIQLLKVVLSAVSPKPMTSFLNGP